MPVTLKVYRSEDDDRDIADIHLKQWNLLRAAKAVNGLKDNDAWQAPKLATAARELKFWGCD